MSQRGGARQSSSSASGRRDHAFTIVECHHERLAELQESCRNIPSERAILFDCSALESGRGDLRSIAEALRAAARLRVYALYALVGPVRRGFDAAGFRDLLNHAHSTLDGALQSVRREQSARRAIANQQKRSERILAQLDMVEADPDDDDAPLWAGLDDEDQDDGEVVISFERSQGPVLEIGSLLEPEVSDDEEPQVEAPRVAPIEVSDDEQLEAIPAPRPGRRALRRMAAAEPKYARMDITLLARFVARHIRDDGDMALLEALHQVHQIGEKALLRTLHSDRDALQKRLERLVEASFVEVLESGRFFKTRQYRLASSLPGELTQALAWRRRDHAVFAQWLDGTKKNSRRQKSH